MSIIETLSNCQSADTKFTRLLKRYDPNKYDAEHVHYCRKEWISTLEGALENLVQAVDTLAAHSSDLEQVVLEGWQARVSMGENSLVEFCNKISRKVSSVPTPVNHLSADGSFRCNDTIQAARKASDDAVVDLVIIQEMAKTLSSEVKEIDD